MTVTKSQEEAGGFRGQVLCVASRHNRSVLGKEKQARYMSIIVAEKSLLETKKLALLSR